MPITIVWNPRLEFTKRAVPFYDGSSCRRADGGANRKASLNQGTAHHLGGLDMGTCDTSIEESEGKCPALCVEAIDLSRLLPGGDITEIEVMGNRLDVGRFKHNR